MYRWRRSTCRTRSWSRGLGRSTGRGPPPPRRRARGGGVIYSEASAGLRELVDAIGIPVCETQAGRGALVSKHPLSLGAVGATGTAAANRLAREAALVLGIGTRW